MRDAEFSMRFPLSDINNWANRYQKNARKKDWEQEVKVLTIMAPRVKGTGYLKRDDFLEICRWKSPRPTRYYEDNHEDFIEETTRIALSTSNEQLRIEILTLLHGVKLRVASAILHVAHKDRYPVLDRRALWSLHVRFAESFGLWSQYVSFCRKLADECRVDMRTLDRALWQYSKDNQK